MTEGRLSVVSSRLLMFNRVAKVGSKTLFKLLRTLGRVNGYKVGISNRQEEVEYNISNGQLSDVTGSAHVMGRYLSNAIVSDKSKWRKL